MEKTNSKDILLQELQENTHIERVEDVIFWALEAYAKKEKSSNGAMVAYAIVQRIKDAEKMKELKNKVIRLGVDRGYLPKDGSDDPEDKFAVQYERLMEEIGEAFREIRLRNKEAFDNEYGDVLVLYTNCRYIVWNYSDHPIYVRMMDNTINTIKTMTDRAEEVFNDNYTSFISDKRCLQLAYDKIVSRGGMLINGDWFKPTDKEYQEAKLKELEVEYKSLVDNPKVDGYVGKLKNLYLNLKSLNDSSLSDESISRIVFLETSVYGMLKEA